MKFDWADLNLSVVVYVPCAYGAGALLHALLPLDVLFYVFILPLEIAVWVVVRLSLCSLADYVERFCHAASSIKLALYHLPNEILDHLEIKRPAVRLPSRPRQLQHGTFGGRDHLIVESRRLLEQCMQDDEHFNLDKLAANASRLNDIRLQLLKRCK